MKSIADFFCFDERNTDLKTECFAGLVCFTAVSYVFLLVPSVLSRTGVSFSSAYFAALLAFAVANIFGGLKVNQPLVLRPSIVICAYYVYIIILSEGASCFEGLGILLTAAVLFAGVSACGWRQKIIDTVPSVLREGMPAGIGLMLIVLGLRFGKILVSSPFGLAAVGDIVNPVMYVSLLGLVLIIVFNKNKVKFSVLLGMLITGIISYELDYIAELPGLFRIPVGQEKMFWGISFEHFAEHIIYVLVILLTVIIESTAVITDRNISSETVMEAERIDSAGSLFSAALGMVPQVFSPEGRAASLCGGRTGLVPVTAGVLAVIMLFCEPVMREIAEMPAVYVPALIITGCQLFARVKDCVSADLTEQVPLLLMLIIMGLTGNIATGIGGGTVLYVLLALLCRKKEKISRGLYFLTVMFCGYFIYMVI